MQLRHTKSITSLTILLVFFLTIVSYWGAFVTGTYKMETKSLALQGIGQDIFDLFVIVPLLLLSLFFTLKNSKKALIILAGTVLYILYSFIIYALGIHFNRMFLIYCFTFGASFYLFVLLIIEFYNQKPEKPFDDRMPIKSTAAFFIIIAAMFYFLWLNDIIPAIINDTVPESVRNYNLLVNPVHVIDISFILPGLIIISVLLIKRQYTGYIFAPVFLILLILLSLALAAMAVNLKIKNVSEDLSLVIIFGVLAVVSCIFLFLFFRRLNKPVPA